MNRLRLSAALLTVLAIAAGSTACDSILGIGDVTGTYQLQTVNGQGLPYIEYEDDTWKDEITGASIILNEGTSCVITLSFRETYKPSNTVNADTESQTCTYTVTDSSITIIINDDGETFTTVGTLSGGTLTITEDGDTLVFQK